LSYHLLITRTNCCKLTMALNQPVWAASARRRRFILTRYGGGPRKKPPDPPDPPDRAQQAAAAPTKQISAFRLNRRCGIRYPRDHRATLHPALHTKLPSIFLAGKRQSFHRISPSYRRLFLIQHRHGGRHGHIGSYLATALSERCATGTVLTTTFKAVYWVSITNSILNKLLGLFLLACAIGLFIYNNLFHSPKFHQRHLLIGTSSVNRRIQVYRANVICRKTDATRAAYNTGDTGNRRQHNNLYRELHTPPHHVQHQPVDIKYSNKPCSLLIISYNQYNNYIHLF
jgi:hypothetical protein